VEGGFGGFEESCKSVIAFRGDSNVGVFEDVGNLSDLWRCVSECCRFSLSNTIPTPPPIPIPPKIQRKWVTFTYTSPQIRKVTNVFKHTNIRITFTCNNTLARLSKPTSNTPYDKGGIYSLSCITCNNEYVGQTSRSLKLRYKEHVCYIKYNNLQSAYALHILTANTNMVPLKEQ
jgi:hypothetical protein